ncbi:unnamed protein product [Parnassius apollo]|uniref:(apollo) hypothetical protein n=1 Tax=Parnassius apollo TaxID=110799 RepID=A0A8S3XXL6_PARAO|nr:unnamed protein product [Parnassius apollo]
MIRAETENQLFVAPSALRLPELNAFIKKSNPNPSHFRLRPFVNMTSVVDERVSDEVEALQAILMNDVTIKREGNKPTIIETIVHPLTGDDTDQQYVCVTLEVKLTPDYPDSSPEVTLRNPRGLDDQLLFTINSQIKEKLAECLGQPVVFELIEVIRQHWRPLGEECGGLLRMANW